MPTTRQYRREFASWPPFVGQWFTTGAQATPPSGAYVGKADGADAKRIVASTDIADEGRQTSVQDTSGDFYNGGYIYVPSTLEQRRVTDAGYTDSVDAADVLDDGTTTQVGYVKVSRDLGAILEAGTEVEFHPFLPPAVSVDRLPSIHSLINRALRSMRWVRRIGFIGNAGDRYSLSTHPEITQDAQIAQVYMGETASSNEPSTLDGGASLRWNGSTGYLITGQYQSSGQAFTADIIIPAANWIKASGTWQASTAGLVAENDEAMPPLDAVVKVAHYFAFDALSRYAPTEPDRASWQTERDRAAIIARQYMHFYQPSVNDRPHTVLKTGTGGTYSRRSWP